MGFIRDQEERLAMRLLAYKYQKMDLPLPESRLLREHAVRIVDDAHRIAGRGGRNVVGIVKDLVADIQQKK